MLRSMTGFGRSVREEDDWTQTWEIRSVNGRYLDIKWNLPTIAHSLENKFDRLIRKSVVRGRIEITLKLDFKDSQLKANFDETYAEAMISALERIAESRGDEFVPDYNALLAQPNLWNHVGEVDESEIEPSLLDGLATAIDDWNEARLAEGSVLFADLNSRLVKLEKMLGNILDRAPEIKAERIAVMRTRLDQLMQEMSKVAGFNIEENRLLQEVVILSDKLDVSEELTRLSSHISRLHDLLESSGDVGKKIDFTLQECFREITTCGNKIQDAITSRVIVDFKTELEKCREQVQNIE